jgi:chromosome segregation ATPase
MEVPMEELFETQNIEPSESVRLVVDNLWNAIYGFVDKYQRQSEQLKVIRDENVRLSLENEQAIRRIEDLERLIQELRNEPDDAKFTELETENIRLRKEIEELKLRQNDLFQSSQIPTTSLFDTSEIEPEYRTLQKEYEVALAEVASKDQTIAELKNKILDLENQTDALIKQLLRMEELEKNNEELNTQIEILKQGKEKSELFFEEQQNKILELTQKNDELTKLVEELKSNIHRQSSLDQDLENTKQLLEQKRSEMESIVKEI